MAIELIFQMACILKPECNFLHGYFRCLLLLETVVVEVKIKMMRGIHIFMRDWTAKVISCNPWITRIHPYPFLIRKIKTYLELEGKLGTQNQPCTNIFLPDKNSLPRKTPIPKNAEQKRRAKAPVKRRFKVRVITEPIPTNHTLLPEPTPIVVTTMVTSPMPVARSAATTTAAIPVTVYNLAQGKFKGILYSTDRLQEKEGFSTPAVTTPL